MAVSELVDNDNDNELLSVVQKCRYNTVIYEGYSLDRIKMTELILRFVDI